MVTETGVAVALAVGGGRAGVSAHRVVVVRVSDNSGGAGGGLAVICAAATVAIDGIQNVSGGEDKCDGRHGHMWYE